MLANVNNDITQCFNSRDSALTVGTQYGTWSGNIAKLTATGTGTATWTITFTHTVTFANNTAFNNFFNCGGRLKWDVAKSSTGTLADAEWNDLATTLCGNIYLTGSAGSKNIVSVPYTGTTKEGGTGTANVLTTSTGAFALTTSPVTLYKQFADTSPYTGQYIQLNASVNSATPTAIVFTTTWVDPGGSGAGSTDDISGGTDTTSPNTTIVGTAPTTLVTYIPPETVYITNTWGTPTIAAAIT